jgi:hypothetical protein
MTSYRQVLSRLVRNSASAVAITVLTISGCTLSEPEKPGKLSNARLAALYQKAIDAEVALMNPTWAPGLLPGAPVAARKWLAAIMQVSIQCTKGPDDFSKGNRLEYTVTLQSGEIISKVASGIVCQYQKGFGKPLVALLLFKDGKVVDALTDGRELEAPISFAQRWINDAAERILRADQDRNRDAYYPPTPTPAQNKQEWKQ